jgi:hypothetical protein
MPLSADQQAMLQLLLERGQSYGDLASVLGVGEDEMRSRARAALAELAGADPDRNVGLTDYLLGQADPIGRADAVRHLKDDPEDLALATELSQKLRLIAPQGELPRLPGEERRPAPRRRPRLGISRLPLPERLRRSRAAEPAVGAPAEPRSMLTRRQTQLMVGLGSGAVLLIVVILAVTGAFSGSSSSSGSTTAATTAQTQTLTRVQLQPQGGGSGSGAVSFGLANGQQPFVDVRLRGLQPPPSGQTYVIWLLLTPNQGYPLSPFTVDQSGGYQNRFPIPAPIIPVLARVQLVNVSVAPVTTVRAAIQKAIKQRNIVIKRPGKSVLQGAIPKSSAGTGSSSGG